MLDANPDQYRYYVCVRCAPVGDFESSNGLRVPDAVKQLGSIVDAHVEVRGLCAMHQQEQDASKQQRQSKQKPVPKHRSTL